MVAVKKEEQDPQVEEVQVTPVATPVVTMATRIDIPSMTGAPSYDHWKNMIRMWTKVTATAVKKQALSITLTLPVEGQKLAMQIIAELEKEDGTSVEKLLTKLDELYELNKDQKIFSAFEAFEQFKRPEDMPVVKFIAGFDERVKQLFSKTIIYFLSNQYINLFY